MSYAGGNESMWSNDDRYFDRKCTEFLTFGPEKPCLCLKNVCWMDPWAIIENVQIPNFSPVCLNVFFFHKYGRYFSMHVQFKISIAV